MMDWIYFILWFSISVIIFFKFSNRGKIFSFVSGYFLFAALWRFLNIVTPIEFFDGVLLTIFRIISAIVLLVTCIYYYKLRKQSLNR